jgi:hypothetical protein
MTNSTAARAEAIMLRGMTAGQHMEAAIQAMTTTPGIEDGANAEQLAAAATHHLLLAQLKQQGVTPDQAGYAEAQQWRRDDERRLLLAQQAS